MRRGRAGTGTETGRRWRRDEIRRGQRRERRRNEMRRGRRRDVDGDGRDETGTRTA